jgi:hypothetical protein
LFLFALKGLASPRGFEPLLPPGKGDFRDRDLDLVRRPS